jgi:putative addiction module component (TIGR02574 family)
MNTANEILGQALNLPAEQRAEIANKLLQSLPDDDDLPVVVDQELEAEVHRRITEHRLGRAKTVDLETFKKTLREAARGPAAP